MKQEASVPIDMILYCPRCGAQHVDRPEGAACGHPVFDSHCRRIRNHRGHCTTARELAVWTNPPHKSHLCCACGTIWRPADVPTNGVKRIKTVGADDNYFVSGE